MSEDFIPKRAFESWTYEGVECVMAVAPLGNGVNGYVRLPQDHPDRGRGYSEMDTVFTAPGGLTYGCDEFGWIGFDTSHGWDVWSSDELFPLLEEGSPEMESFRVLNKVHMDVRRELGPPVTDDPKWMVHWTVEMVRVATEVLASQVAAWGKMEEEVT